MIAWIITHSFLVMCGTYAFVPPSPIKRVEWFPAGFSDCSVTCGSGEEVSVVYCRDAITTQRLQDQFCLDARRPPTKTRPCKRQGCSPIWITGDWQPCSKSCGGGLSMRTSYCVEELKDGSFQRTLNKLCPPTDESQTTNKTCNEFECPKWFAGQWSPCSRTCGSGFQLRAIVCRRTELHDCVDEDKPVTRRLCHTDMPCIGETAESVIKVTVSKFGDSKSGDSKSEDSSSLDNNSQETGAAHGGLSYGRASEELLAAYDVDDKERFHGASSFNSQDYSAGGRGSETAEHGREDTGFDVSSKDDEDGDGASGEVEVGYIKSNETGGGQELAEDGISTTPSFVTSPWGPCSVTCGVGGVRTRTVTCKVRLAFTETVRKLPDQSCAGIRPKGFERCMMKSCHQNTNGNNTYSWQFNGYGPCSQSCGKGIESPIFACQRSSDNTTVKKEKCSGHPLDTSAHTPRPCSLPCPPRWRVVPHGPCSVSCGGGLQLLFLQCVRESLEGVMQAATRASCADPEPPRTVTCNNDPCPPSWTLGDWSQCSATCGLGYRTRPLQCERALSAFKVAVVDNSLCLEHASAPVVREPCQQSNCTEADQHPESNPESSISAMHRTMLIKFVQLKPKEKVSLRVNGSAVLIPGSTVFIHCPVLHLNKGGIKWTKDGLIVDKKGRVKLTEGGVLRIRGSRNSDGGLYSCVAGGVKVNVSIDFQSIAEAAKMAAMRDEFVPNWTIERAKASESEEDSQEQKQDDSLAIYASSTAIAHLLEKESSQGRFVAGDWSSCSKSCGADGNQMRNISCEIIQDDYTLVVEDLYCKRGGLSRPIDKRECKLTECPRWVVGPWEECTSEHCYDAGIGSRHRQVDCKAASNATHSPVMTCDPALRPNEREKCSQDQCRVAWNTSAWSACSVSCGGKGHKTRALRCVWVHNKMEAKQEMCDSVSTARPEASKPCYELQSCRSTEACRDESRYCHMVVSLKMCHNVQYRRQCCHSCRRLAHTKGLHQRNRII